MYIVRVILIKEVKLKKFSHKDLGCYSKKSCRKAKPRNNFL